MNAKIDEYIDKQPDTQKEVCKYLRNFIFKNLPGIDEEMKWGVPVFAGGKFYIVSLKDHVNLGFAIKGLNESEIADFEGSGKTMRHVKIKSINDIDEEKLVKLIKLVNEKAECQSC